ncbi:MAG: HD domain-containing protein [Planctomycetota bacterium]
MTDSDTSKPSPPSPLVAATEAFVRERLAGEGTGHDWWHTDRVRRNALALAAREGADPLVVELAALLHDIADHKFHGGDHSVGPRVAGEFLRGAGADDELIKRVCTIIGEVSYSKGLVPASIEGRCVQDADRLDALGAIGIARCFAFGGKMDRALWDPDAPAGTSLQHFDDKLFRLRDKMSTAAGRAAAAERHERLVMFREQFLAEWNGTL